MGSSTSRLQGWISKNRLGVGIGTGAILMCLVAWVSVSTETDQTPEEPDATPERMAVAEIKILNEDESWFGKAELYLKVSSSLHSGGQAVLFPINVGEFSGRRQLVQELPFAHQKNVAESLIFEVLDDDELSEDQEKAIFAATKSGVVLLWISGKLYALSHGVVLPDEGGKVLTEVSSLTTGLVLENLGQHVFDSYGTANYRVPEDAPTDLRDANTVTVVDDANSARIEIRIYYPTMR